MAATKMRLDPGKMGSEAETLEKELRQRIVGQDEAIRQIVDMYQVYLAGMTTPGRPIGTMLFLGPTGAGKTRTVEALAESLAGDARAVIKIDCAEFQHSHEIAKLIGSPPGYLGHRETHPLLSQEAIDQFQTDKLKLSFVLFDEIEKASDALWNLLLGILDKATLTLGDNRRVDFSRCMIFLTSNLGAAGMSAILQPSLGFTAGRAALDASTTDRIARSGVEAARRTFSPEFINRIDRTVVFRPLGRVELDQILDLELNAVRARLAGVTGARTIRFNVSKAARELLLREGVDPRYGARHLKRAIERRLVQPLSSLIATGQVEERDRLTVDCDNEKDYLVFFKDYREPASAAAA